MASSDLTVVSDLEYDPTKNGWQRQLRGAPWSAFYDANKEVAQLAWPNSPTIYNRMRTDEQIAVLLLSFTLPIQGYRWYIDQDGPVMRSSRTLPTTSGCRSRVKNPSRMAG